MPKPVDKGVLINAPGAPTEGSDAGDGEDLQLAYVKNVVDSYSKKAKQLFKLSRNRFTQINRSDSVRLVNQSLENAIKAFWWSEDTEYEETQHELLHKIGAWKHKHLGCHLYFDGERYHQKCLVALAHKKMGFSIGFFGDRICSLCEQDLSECPHRRDRTYWIRGERNARGLCRICNEKSCEHRGDHLYRTRVITRIENSVLEEISIVRRPANPEARLQEVPIDTNELVVALGPTFKIGMPVSCHMCKGECLGFMEFDMPPPA